MTKYWNERRVQKTRQKREGRERAAYETAVDAQHSAELRAKSHAAGDHTKNLSIMLDALGVPMRRKIVAYLQKNGTMSVSKLAEHFKIKLPTALEHVRILEMSSLISTHKQGRVRLCVYNPASLKELARLLDSHTVG